MWGCVLVLSTATLLLHLSSCHNISNVDSLASITSQLSSIMDRLTSMDQRFNALDLRITALDQRLTALNGGCDENNLLTTVTETPSITKKPGTTFRITRVTKEERADFYKVRVEYDASSKPAFVMLRLQGEDAARPQENRDFGVVEIHVPKDTISRDLGQTNLLFSYWDHYFTTYLQLLDTPNSMVVPRITAEVDPGSDVTFPPGGNAELNFTLKVEGDPKALDQDRFQSWVIMKSDTVQNRVDRFLAGEGTPGGFPIWLEAVSLHGQSGDRHATVRINSTLDDPRGLLEIYAEVGFNCSENCLLRRLVSTTTVTFYSEIHSGPFPDGFLGFVHDQFRPNPSKVVCDVGDPACAIRCEVAGSDSSAAELTKILPSGDVIPTDDRTLLAHHWSATQLNIVNVSYADAGAFRCTARSGLKEIAMDIHLAVVKVARIDQNLTQVTRFENGSLAATCTAEGNPAPNVTFDTDFYPLSDASPGDYDVTMTQLDEWRTRADIFVIDPDLALSMSSLFCRATNIDITENNMYPDVYIIDLNGNSSFNG